MTAPADIELPPDCSATAAAAGHAEGVAGIDRCITRLKEDFARREALLRRPTVAHVIERHPVDVRKPVPAWLWRVGDWLLAFALGFGLAYSAAQGF